MAVREDRWPEGEIAPFWTHSSENYGEILGSRFEQIWDAHYPPTPNARTEQSDYDPPDYAEAICGPNPNLPMYRPR